MTKEYVIIQSSTKHFLIYPFFKQLDLQGENGGKSMMVLGSIFRKMNGDLGLWFEC